MGDVKNFESPLNENLMVAKLSKVLYSKLQEWLNFYKTDMQHRTARQILRDLLSCVA